MAYLRNVSRGDLVSTRELLSMGYLDTSSRDYSSLNSGVKVLFSIK